MMKSISFINVSYLCDIYCQATIPVGLYYLSSALKNKKITVNKILNLAIIKYKNIRKELENLISSEPSIIGLSAFSNNYDYLNAICNYIKHNNKNIKIIVGGPITTSMPKELLKLNSNIDFAIIGEAEESLPALVNSIYLNEAYDNIPGLVYRSNNEIIANPVQPLSLNLDKISIDWDEVNFDHYSNFLSASLQKGKIAQIITSRGCPYSCIFCTKTMGNNFRARSVENVLEELHLLRNKYNITKIEIIDEIFNYDYDRAVEILTRIGNELPDVSIYFGTGLRLNKIDENFVKLMKHANCKWLYLPIETVNSRIQKLIKKVISKEHILNIVNWTNKYKIYTFALYMVGFPTETKNEMLETLNFGKDLNSNLASFCTPIPFIGSELDNILTKKTNITTQEKLNNIGDYFYNYSKDFNDFDDINIIKTEITKIKFKNKSNIPLIFDLFSWKFWWFDYKYIFKVFLYNILKIFFKNKPFLINLIEENKNSTLKVILKSIDTN